MVDLTAGLQEHIVQKGDIAYCMSILYRLQRAVGCALNCTGSSKSRASRPKTKTESEFI